METTHQPDHHILKLSITPSERKLIGCIPHFRSLVQPKLYANNYNDNGLIVMHEILSSLVEMNLSTIPLPLLEALEIICHATEENQRLFMKVIDPRWWSDEEENARRKQGQRPLSRIKTFCSYECSHRIERVL